MPKKKPAAEETADVPAKKPGEVYRPDENAQEVPGARAEASKNLIKELYTGLVEQTFTVSPYVPASMQRPYNPDELFKKRNDYGIYEEMCLDDQVSICLQLKKDLVLGAGWDILIEDEKNSENEDAEEDSGAQKYAQEPADDPAEPESDDSDAGSGDLNERIKKELTVSLNEQCEGDFDDMLAEICSAYEFGFSLTEKVFKINPDMRLGLKYLRTRHPASWLIHTDDQGGIERYEQRAGASDKGRAIQSVDVNPKSLIHYVNNPRFQNPYGQSDLRVAYNAWFTKRQVIKYFAIFLEKAASPIPWAQYEGTPPQEAVTDIFNALKSFQAKTALVVPKAFEVAFLESKNSGEAYDRAINLFNMFIGRALFIPDLLGFQGAETGGGSFALGKDQIRIFMHHIARRRKKLENLVNMHMIRPLVLYNYGEMECYPKFRLKPLDDEMSMELAKLWLEAVKGKAFKPNDEEINYFRALCKFPEGEVQEEEPAAPTDPSTGMPMHKNDPRNPHSPAHPLNSKNKGVVTRAQKKAARTPLIKPEPKGAVKKKFELARSSYGKKVNFAAIEHSMDRHKARVTGEIAPIARAAMRDLYRQIESQIGDHPDRVDDLQRIDISPQYKNALHKVLVKSMTDAHTEARTMAADELQQKNYKAPLPDDKFMQVLRGESTLFVTDWAANLTKRARARVVAAIKDGVPLASIMDAGTDEGAEDSDVAIERYARTKFTEVMNRGRMEYFNDSGIVKAYEYSAILDDRTSDICAGLDGKIFEKDDAPIPPMHFNCRSLLVPITKYEAYEADEDVDGQDIDRFIEENKGDGFPTR